MDQRHQARAHARTALAVQHALDLFATGALQRGRVLDLQRIHDQRSDHHHVHHVDLVAVGVGINAKQAGDLGLGTFLGGADGQWVLLLEALVGAVYLENGYAFTRKFIVLEILRKYLDIHRLEGMDDNFKSQLLEWCQKNNMEVNYELVSKYKFEKRDRFKIAVMIQGEQVAEADDFNKKNAEQIASEKAMMKLGILSLEDAETSLL